MPGTNKLGVGRAPEDLLGAPVAFAEDCVGKTADQAVAAMRPGDVLLLQNLRFHAGEEANDPDFARALAANGDFYVDDASLVNAARVAHAVARYAPIVMSSSSRLQIPPSTVGRG